MDNREKFQVWSEDHQRWRTAYVRPDKLLASIVLMRSFSIKFRTGGRSTT